MTRHRQNPTPSSHDDFGGLRRDRPQLIARRRALQLTSGVGLAGLLAACGSAADTAAPIPSETEGPFPADGSNGPNVLSDGAVVRADLTTSFGDFSGSAAGVPTTVELTLVSAANGSPLSAAALYIWQCSADGRYSIYEIEDQNYMRGVQVADDEGRLSFSTVYPGCYVGRWPHWHIEVYDSLDSADQGAKATRISQIALPEEVSAAVYDDERYSDSASNLSRLSIETDGIFADGWSDQLATVSGSNEDGYTASLLIRI